MENSDFENSDARKNQRFASSIDLYELQAFGRDQSGRDQASSYGELSNRIIWNIRKSVFQCKEQNRQKFIENVSETKKLLIENLLKKFFSIFVFAPFVTKRHRKISQLSLFVGISSRHWVDIMLEQFLSM